MNWKQWKRGLVIAVLTGIATTLAGVAVGLNWKQLLALGAMNIGKDMGLYLAQHPNGDITDTTFINKPQPPQP